MPGKWMCALFSGKSNRLRQDPTENEKKKKNAEDDLICYPKVKCFVYNTRKPTIDIQSSAQNVKLEYD